MFLLFASLLLSDDQKNVGFAPVNFSTIVSAEDSYVPVVHLLFSSFI